MHFNIGYKDELDFLSKNIRPRLIEIDTSIKEKAQQARECMDAAREKRGYSIVYKSAKRKRKSGKEKVENQVCPHVQVKPRMVIIKQLH